MKEITLVTAFFNIGRESFKAIPRTDNVYLNNFEFWARIKNNLIVYTSENFADEIMNVRSKFGLEDKTKIIIIEDIEKIEPEIFNRMTEISNDQYFISYRFLPNATSSIAKYSYLMLLKSWFMADAVERNLTSETVAWLDFGYNHGGDLFIHPEEFDFEWRYDFSDKIHLFYYKELDNKPIFETVRRLNDSIMGAPIIIPRSLCKELWNLNKQAMITLNKVGLIDDDQLIQLMSYREKPELFEITESEWFLPLKTFGGEHLSIKKNEKLSNVKSVLRKVKSYFRYRKLIFRYIFVTYNNLTKK